MEKWKKITDDGASCLKVNGGYIYKDEKSNGIAMCFVPDIDLQRYESHLRDAYNKGYADGQEDAKNCSPLQASCDFKID